MKALAGAFHITFATAAQDRQATRRALSSFVDEAIVLPSAYPAQALGKLRHKVAAAVYAAFTGLKASNYTIGCVELTPERLLPSLAGRRFDCALFEYWHAASLVPSLQERSVPCVLDMHNVLWQARSLEMRGLSRAVPWAGQLQLERYRQHEEQIWPKFDGIVAISAGELEYVSSRVPSSTTIFYAPMGVDVASWPFGLRASNPARVAFYGSLGNRHNQDSALRCVERIMPAVWQQFPDAELWIVGNNPPKSIQRLAQDERIRITGFVPKPQDLLATMTVALCPWSGQFGFRSRLVELMSIGVPVVSTSDAVFGMGLAENEAVLIGETDQELADLVIRLISIPRMAERLSRHARELVERTLSLEATYGEFSRQLHAWVQNRAARSLESGAPV